MHCSVGLSSFFLGFIFPPSPCPPVVSFSLSLSLSLASPIYLGISALTKTMWLERRRPFHREPLGLRFEVPVGTQQLVILGDALPVSHELAWPVYSAENSGTT